MTEVTTTKRSLATIEEIMKKMGYAFDGIESNLMAELDENSNFIEVPHQDIKTIITKHTYGGTKEVKLVHLEPLELADLQNEGLEEIGIEPNKEMYMVFVKNIEGALSDIDTELAYSKDQSNEIAA